MSRSDRSSRLSRGIALAVCLGIVGCGSGLCAQAPTVVASGAWAREPAPSRDVTSVYVVLENTGSVEHSIVSGTSEAAARVELHEMRREGGMMRMAPVARIVLPAGTKVELKPGGLHLMLFGLKRRPAPGDSLEIVLKLDDGSALPVRAKVRTPEPQP
jgi:copper(I)-binding protein